MDILVITFIKSLAHIPSRNHNIYKFIFYLE